VADYYRMGEVGILGPDARVELIDGEIIDMAPIGPPHAGTVNRLVRLLGLAVGDRAVLLVQNPVVLSRHSAPQPDLALALPRTDFYASRHPGPADAVLVVEVVDTTLPFDRDIKIGLYARYRISEVWLIDLQAKRLVRYRTPRRGAYEAVDQPDLGSPLEIAALPGVRVDLGTLFQ
jgi:Uma2 family endonuclease